MNPVKRFFKLNSHSLVMKPLAGLGRSINRLYENRNHDGDTNGENNLLIRFSSLNPKVIFDVGANTGDYALLAAGLCKSAAVYSFEPVRETFNLLQANLNNDEGQRIVAINKGLYKTNGKLQINKYPRNTLASLYDIKGLHYPVVGTEEIEVISGDDFMSQNDLTHIDLLKMDVEGAEMDALLGLSVTFERKLIRLIQFEYGYINITTKNLLADYYDFFRSHDYIVGKIYPKTVEFREYSFKHEDFIGPNFAAVKKSDKELISILSK
jgi:FkbM family methyltransferase